MPDRLVRVERVGPVAHAILNDPDRRNAMSGRHRLFSASIHVGGRPGIRRANWTEQRGAAQFRCSDSSSQARRRTGVAWKRRGIRRLQLLCSRIEAANILGFHKQRAQYRVALVVKLAHRAPLLAIVDWTQDPDFGTCIKNGAATPGAI